MPLYWRTKIITVEVEGTYGQDAAPDGGDAILATQVRLMPMEGNDISRDLDTPHFGAQPTIPAEVHAKLEFRVELQGSGAAGTPPGYSKVLRALGIAETISAGVSVAYSPVTDDHEAVTVHFFVGSTRYKLLGTRGTGSIQIDAQGIPYLLVTLTGLYSPAGESARPTPNLTAFQPPEIGTTANTPTFQMGGVDFVMRSFKLDLGNEVQNRFLIGSESVLITDKAEMVETTVEAVPLTTFDPYALAAAQSVVPINLVHGTDAGKIVTLNVPTAQMQRPQGLENAQNVVEWPLRLVPLPTAGNDQWTLTFT